MSRPYYYNYELTHRYSLKQSQDILPSFSLIDFYEKEIRSKLRESFPHKRSILELGCGQGSLFSGLNEEVTEIVGVDVSQTAINEAKKNLTPRSHIQYVEADVCQLALGKQFEFVYDAHTFHCLCGNEERGQYLKKAYEHTVSGGYFALETMVAHKKMDFEEGYLFRENEQILYKQIEDEEYVGLRTFYGRRYMPLRSIKHSHEIEAELSQAGFKIIFFMVLSGYKVIYDERRIRPLNEDPDLLRIICRKD